MGLFSTARENSTSLHADMCDYRIVFSGTMRIWGLDRNEPN